MSGRKVGRLLLFCLAGLLVSEVVAGVDIVTILRLLVGPRFDIPAAVAVGAAGAVLDMAIATTALLPILRWYASDATPTPAQRKQAVDFPVRHSLRRGVVWAVAAAVLLAVHHDAGWRALGLIAVSIPLGGATSCFMGYLFAERVLRRVFTVAFQGADPHRAPRRVAIRLTVTWALYSGIPLLGIVAIVGGEHIGWDFGDIAMPVFVSAVIGLVAGLRSITFVAHSVAVPLREVTAAMRRIGEGHADTRVAVYDTSEIGLLQSGFNEMAAAISERERLQDLFGRHVGHDVARLALQNGAGLSGGLRSVAVMFIDLAGSTTFASTHSPDRVVALLNTFFRHVVAAVDRHGGIVNKFEGDAVLAIFGAPAGLEDAAGAALAAARELRELLRSEPDMLDFGIGVTYGPVFAGNVGAENRYEYTVIGDSVNEAARVSDLAKDHPSRALAAESALAAAAPAESGRWRLGPEVTLRGRTAPTTVAAPAT
ncbi:MAG: adenylate/guanylate cyclase domain-containing protein [Mycobacteriaceae bacterium]|nr:adenylate/guanylate cyclase domain-containing protein [Mycobacteriaceae bacterium]